MNALVTGGAGFIGSHLVSRLLASGRKVRVLDNLSTGKRENLPPHERLEFIEGDIRDTSAVASAMHGMQAVVHLAAVASVQASIDDPLGTHQTNLVGTINLLEAARQNSIARFVYASSAAVYGDSAQIPVAEDAHLNPLSPYAADKLAGEHYLDFYRRTYGLSTAAFRFFNIYGPRQDPSSPYSGVISIFVDRLRARKPVTVFGDGRQTRDFVYVGDLVDVLVRTIENKSTADPVCNIGRGVESSLLDLLEALEQLSGRRIERRHESQRPGDIVRSCADVSRLQSITGSVPATPLRDGLRELLQYTNAI
jgi:UDP-glucose 4-epimerase